MKSSKPFVVEIKNRRGAKKLEGSIWGESHLKAFADGPHDGASSTKSLQQVAAQDAPFSEELRTAVPPPTPVAISIEVPTDEKTAHAHLPRPAKRAKPVDHILNLATDVVAAYVARNAVPRSELPTLIGQVRLALASLSRRSPLNR
ncbi:MucR family transcriptional regulator [Aminobacter sp. MSH1]|uniref:MucR family transcriptional regulator n=1 Tax=Aminobacter sp. MSH1 TaxID=374606 RepID=UPI000D3493C2